MNNYYNISYEKELQDTNILVDSLIKSDWVKEGMIIVNCSPDYSSRLCQNINHKLSHINNNELFEVIELPMPYPTMSQVWDTREREFVIFDNYLYEWIRRYIYSTDNYLFVDSGTLRGKNFTKVRSGIRQRLTSDNYRFATLYLESNSIFTPNFFVERFDKYVDGGLLFEWENVNNPNWDY